MKYQETGRFGRITKNLRKLGFEDQMPEIIHDSEAFNSLNKKQQTEYVEKVTNRMVKAIGQENANSVLFECGAQCCGKSWASFARRIYDNARSLDGFFIELNKEETKYNTTIQHDPSNDTITVNRSKCICGLINKGAHFNSNKSFCGCSIGHMSVFFNAVFEVRQIDFLKSIFNGDDTCEWRIKIEKPNDK